MARIYQCIVILILVACMGIGLSRFSRQRESASWLVTTGTITSFDLSISYTPTRGGATRAYSPKVAYLYHVGGLPYFGHRFSLYDADEIPAYMVPDLQRARTDMGLTTDSRVNVHYDPRDPSSSYLINRTSGFPIVLAILPAVPLAICLMLFGRKSGSSEGFWTTIFLFMKEQPRSWLILRLALVGYPVLFLCIFGLQSAKTSNGAFIVAALVHYGLLLAIKPFANFARTRPQGNSRQRLTEV